MEENEKIDLDIKKKELYIKEILAYINQPYNQDVTTPENQYNAHQKVASEQLDELIENNQLKPDSKIDDHHPQGPGIKKILYDFHEKNYSDKKKDAKY